MSPAQGWKPLGHLEHEEMQLVPIFWFCWWVLLWQNLPGAAYAELGHVLSLARLRAGVAASKDPLRQSLVFLHHRTNQGCEGNFPAIQMDVKTQDIAQKC